MKSSIFVLLLIAAIANGTENADDYEFLLKKYRSRTYVDRADLSELVAEVKSLKKGIEQCNSRFDKNSEDTGSILRDSAVFDIRTDKLPEKCKTDTLPKSCTEATACTQRSGIYMISLAQQNISPFLVECDVKTEGGDWTLIQRRHDGSVDFYRDWSEYKHGFGDRAGEFFIGLDNLHALTNHNGPQELLIVLDTQNETRRAFYSNFVIGDERDGYDLKHLGVYSGDAGDSLNIHLGAKFSTKDRDNDTYPTSCAQEFTGAWWYLSCHHSNLNGKYGDDTHGKGLNWYTFRGQKESIPRVTMMIRRRSF